MNRPRPDPLYRADGGSVIYLLDGVADAGSAGWPVASFRVGDARATVRALRDPDGSVLTIFSTAEPTTRGQ